LQTCPCTSLQTCPCTKMANRYIPRVYPDRLDGSS
jgi:hypothetical protein